MSDVLRALGEAAHAEAERHDWDWTTKPDCKTCRVEHPCPSRVFADRVIRDLHADTREREARDQQLRGFLEAIYAGRYLPDEAHPWMNDLFTSKDYRRHATGALALLAKPHTEPA